jgi:threonine synthase
MNGYRCFACAAVQTADFDGFLCPSCGGNLDILYDYVAAGRELAGGFDQGSSGIFRYRALLPVTEPEPGFPLRVGGTPLYEAARLGRRVGLRRLYLKDDSANPSASLKDRAGVVALCRAIETEASVVATASTGNAGSSMACLASALGLQAVVFVPEKAPAAKLTQLLAYGARVLAVRGTYDDAYDLCLAASEEFGWFNRSTGFNPFTREGKKTVAFETWEDLGCRVPDRMVVPTGDGNIISSVWKGWKDLKAAGLTDRLPKIDCAQSVASAAVCRTVQNLRDSGEKPGDWSNVAIEEVTASTLADSISVDRPRDGIAAVRAVLESGGQAVTVPDEQILEAAMEMARYAGVFPEPAAATPWAVVRQMAADGTIAADEQVVCLVTGSGLKDAANAARAAGTAEVIEPTLKDVMRVMQGRDR